MYCPHRKLQLWRPPSLDIFAWTYLTRSPGWDGTLCCLVLSCSDVEHAIWRHCGSVSQSAEMNGHQHNPLSAHVSWCEQNGHFCALVCRVNVFCVCCCPKCAWLEVDPRCLSHWRCRLATCPVLPVANHGCEAEAMFFSNSLSQPANWQAARAAGEPAPALSPRRVWRSDRKCNYICVIRKMEMVTGECRDNICEKV